MSDAFRAIAAPRKLLEPDHAEVLRRCWRSTGPPFNQAQIEMLHEVAVCRGEAGIVGVGWGKSRASFAMAAMVGAKRPMIVVRSALVDNLWREHAKWAPHDHIVPFTVRTYEDFSNRRKLDELPALAPDLIVFDEAHRMKMQTSARWKNIVAYLRDHMDIIIVFLSGTITTKNTDDYAHLFQAALRQGSPVPYPGELASAAWRRCLGDIPDPQDYDFMHLKPLLERYPHPGPHYMQGRHALQQHLRSTAGVVMTQESSCASSIICRSIKDPPLPRHIEDLAEQCVLDRKDPDGEPIALHEADLIRRSLDYGFWYRKDWGPHKDKAEEWRMSVGRWNRMATAYLREPDPGITSPAALADATRKGKYPELEPVLRALDAVEGWYTKVPVWAWRGWIDAQIQWLLTRKEPTIGWYASATALDREWDKHGVDRAPNLYRPSVCALSIWKYREGLNLQSWTKARYMQPPRDAGVWQQSMARIHRLGQEADEVEFEVCLHAKGLRNRLKASMLAAGYVQDTTGERQRLLLATWE